jgi:hypothetical protein
MAIDLTEIQSRVWYKPDAVMPIGTGTTYLQSYLAPGKMSIEERETEKERGEQPIRIDKFIGHPVTSV